MVWLIGAITFVAGLAIGCEMERARWMRVAVQTFTSSPMSLTPPTNIEGGVLEANDH